MRFACGTLKKTDKFVALSGFFFRPKIIEMNINYSDLKTFFCKTKN